MKRANWIFLTLLLATQASAFSLLGPYTDWMQRTNGFRLDDDIGGPMDLGEEYRWNVPLVTYAFDQTFLDYFGSNGIAAVEEAIQILNDLPPATEMLLTNYAQTPRSSNWMPDSQRCLDLKSATLARLVEQMGLGKPKRNIYVFRQADPLILDYLRSISCADELCWGDWLIPDYIIERNFDPESLASSHSVNGVLCFGVILDPVRGPYICILNHPPVKRHPAPTCWNLVSIHLRISTPQSQRAFHSKVSCTRVSPRTMWEGFAIY